jgi:hypothetical protein
MAEQLIFKCEHFICKIAIGRVLLRTGCMIHLLLTYGSVFVWPPYEYIGFRNILDTLIAKGVDLGVRRDGDGETVLHIAVRQRIAVRQHNLEIVECLLQSQPTLISLPDTRARTPLHTILEVIPPPTNYRTVVQRLISVNADLFARNWKDHTPLLSACANPYIESSVLSDLIQAGSDVNYETVTGETAMSLVLDCLKMFGNRYDSPITISWSESLSWKAKILIESGMKPEYYLTQLTTGKDYHLGVAREPPLGKILVLVSSSSSLLMRRIFL